MVSSVQFSGFNTRDKAAACAGKLAERRTAKMGARDEKLQHIAAELDKNPDQFTQKAKLKAQKKYLKALQNLSLISGMLQLGLLARLGVDIDNLPEQPEKKDS